MKLFIRALAREAEFRAAALSASRGGETSTLYFGGGTPSMLSDTHLGNLMESLDRLIPVDSLDEFSFEANPATFTEKKVRFWRSLGMNRVSLGVQSLDARILRLLGREHTPEQALRSVEMLHNAGMPHVNMDLMFAIPGQSLSVWENTLREAVRAGTDHISAYNLTYEEDTEFFRSLSRGEKIQDQTRTQPTLNWRKTFWKPRECGITKPPTTPGKARGLRTTWPTGRGRTM